jgi:histidinol-phosphate aminotransferase
VDLKQLGFRLWDFQANFLLVQSPKVNAEQIYLPHKQWGILVRYFKQPGLEDKFCITVGTDEQNQMLVEALIYPV